MSTSLQLSTMRSLGLLLIGAVLGCGGDLLGPSPGNVRLTTDRAAYGLGDTVVVKLEALRSLQFSICDVHLEREQGSTWIWAVSPGGAPATPLPCPMPQPLWLGQRAELHRVLEPGLPAGQYRYSAGTSDHPRAVSAPFSVAATP